MRRIFLVEAGIAALLGSCVWQVATSKVKADSLAGEPPPAEVVHKHGASLVEVDHPERFSLATATRHASAPELKVTGVVSADVSRNVPVISIATGRIRRDPHAIGRHRGEGPTPDARSKRRYFRKPSRITNRHVADEKLAVAQLARSKALYDKGAIAQKDLEVAQDTEEKADVTVETTIAASRVLGADKDHPTAIVDVTAPVAGVITDQQVTAAAGTQGLASPNAFTISDLSHVWILCDVYENDLAFRPRWRVRRYSFERLSEQCLQGASRAISDRFSIRISAPQRFASKWRIPA